MSQFLVEDDVNWMIDEVDTLTDEVELLSPSEWAERDRYIPASVSPMPGRFSFKIMPFLEEIVDCFDTRSPIREVNFMKGSQLGWTTGVLENIVGYSIRVVKSAPMMWLTADAELAKLRMEQNVTPMIQQSGLEDSLQSNDELSGRKSAKTDKKIEWVGGGYILPYGAINANKMRQTSIKYMLEDEVDGYPDVVGKDGDPCRVAESRCKGYWAVRKIMRGSTPLLKGTSKIERQYLEGDQRHYMVKCLHCGEPQQLRFNGRTEENKEYGLIYELDEDFKLKPETVRYRCKHCGHDHREADKMAMLAPDNAEWVPTAKPKSKDVRSYHLSSLYSPSVMFGWAECIQAYLDAWDVQNNRVKDMGQFQYFYNHVLGETFQPRSNKLRFETVSAHRRPQFVSGQIPNGFAKKYCEGPVCLLTLSADIHKSHIDVAVWGWTRGQRVFGIQNWCLEGDCEKLSSTPWKKLANIIENYTYKDSEGRKYAIQLSLVDSSWNTDLAVSFCSEYTQGVIPVMGKPFSGNRSNAIEWKKSQTATGHPLIIAFVDLYKDRWHAKLRYEWDGVNTQPSWHFNAPIDLSDQRLKELTVEHRKQRFNKETNQAMGWEWHRPSGAANEYWDLLIYGTVALEVIAHELMIETLEEPVMDWIQFWDRAEQPGLYFDQN